MDVQLKGQVPSVQSVPKQRAAAGLEYAVLAYWAISGVLGLLFLSELLGQWNLAATWSQPWLVGLLIATWGVSQLAYAAVADHGGRRIDWPATIIFALGNGFFETLAFALVFFAGTVLGNGIAAAVLPQFAGPMAFAFGMLFFIIYGGLIHGLFWLRLLPPHLKDTPRARAIRKRRPLVEIGIVTAWSLCFWVTQDFWTVVFFHVLVDFFLMIFVRPPLFQSARR